MRRIVIALAVVGLVMTLGAGLAAAHKTKFPTTATLAAINDKDAAGTVDSDKPKCFKQRTVKVFRQAEGGPAFKPTEVATTESDNGGKWQAKLAGKTKGETFFAKATKKKLRKNRRHKHICKPAKTDTITVPDKVK